jgi:hypothetical protein
MIPTGSDSVEPSAFPVIIAECEAVTEADEEHVKLVLNRAEHGTGAMDPRRCGSAPAATEIEVERLS